MGGDKKMWNDNDDRRMYALQSWILGGVLVAIILTPIALTILGE